MKRRSFLKRLAALFALPCSYGLPFTVRAKLAPAGSRVRPSDAAWPGSADWQKLKDQVGGRLVKVESPFAACARAPSSSACTELFKNLRNPFFIGDNVALTQTLGWTDAWTSKPSAYAVAAQSSADVAAAVTFAREHRLRLVVKGGGHSYLGGSNAPDSLLIWTKAMNTIELHDAFVPKGSAGQIAPEPAVSIGAGALWLEAYDAVTTRGGRYVQGGGCTTVGVAGLVQGGGFGSFSKGFGTGAANLLEAEVVTADGIVRVVNALAEPDLFWALKGGGGGTFGVVTRMTLRTHALPAYFGVASARIVAVSDAAYRVLVNQVLAYYHSSLMNRHWGEQISFNPGRELKISMLFQGLDRAEAEKVWRPFFDWVSARPADYKLLDSSVSAIPARLFWNPTFLRLIPGAVKTDDRAQAPAGRFYWSGDGEQAGQVLHAYQSVWLSQKLLDPEPHPGLIDALVHCASGWGVSLHFNKGLAGAPPEALAWSTETATNPAVLDAFALAICAGEETPAYPGVAGHEPRLADGRRESQQIRAAMKPLMDLQKKPASYVSETDYFQPAWQTAFWGENYNRLKQIKTRYDPDGLFYVYHGVGSESWSADGFTKTA